MPFKPSILARVIRAYSRTLAHHFSARKEILRSKRKLKFSEKNLFSRKKKKIYFYFRKRNFRKEKIYFQIYFWFTEGFSTKTPNLY